MNSVKAQYIVFFLLFLFITLVPIPAIEGQSLLHSSAHSSQHSSIGIGVVVLQYSNNEVKDDTLHFFATDTVQYAFYRSRFQNLFDDVCATPKDSDTILPLEILYPTTSICLRCIDSTALRYKVCINEKSGSIAWIAKDSTVMFQSWLGYFQSADYLISKEPFKLQIAPHDKAKSLATASYNSCFEALKIQDEWIYLIESLCPTISGNPPQKVRLRKGWTRWHHKQELLLSKQYRE